MSSWTVGFFEESAIFIESESSCEYLPSILWKTKFLKTELSRGKTRLFKGQFWKTRTKTSRNKKITSSRNLQKWNLSNITSSLFTKHFTLEEQAAKCLRLKHLGERDKGLQKTGRDMFSMDVQKWRALLLSCCLFLNVISLQKFLF